MARMIPDRLDEEAPPGERAVFEAFVRSPGLTGDWVVFHSLELGRHPEQSEGEADFVVLAPGKGVLVIEVKSHLSVRADGVGNWRLGAGEWTTRSPFEQARREKHAIRDFLESHGVPLVGFPVWHAVWFTAIPRERLPESIGWHPWEVLDASDLQHIGVAVARVLTRAGEHLAATSGLVAVAGEPSAEKVERMRAVLEPEFVAEVTPKERRRRRQAELVAFTAEQVRILDSVRRADRILIEGPAGSGKTFVAVEAARRAAARGDRVLLTVFSRLLEEHLIELLADEPSIEVARIHRLMGRYAGVELPPPASGQQRFYERELPDAALDVVTSTEFAPPFDALVVDEAQDLATEECLDFLDCLVVRGLGGARVVACGDFEWQNVFRSGDTRRPWEERLGPHVPLVLELNCRNTPEVGGWAERLIGDADLYTGFRREDDPIESVTIHPYDDASEQSMLLRDAIRTALDEGYEPRDIVVLSPVRESAAKAALASGADGVRDRLGRDIRDRSRIRWGTIHEFKGLEAACVILTDISAANEHLARVLFSGASRATDRVLVLTDDPRIADAARTSRFAWKGSGGAG